MAINWRIIFVMVVAIVAAASAKSKFEEGLLKVLEKAKRGDTESLPIAVPSLKSFKVEPMRITYDGYTTDLSEATVTGLENLKVEKLSASERDLTVSLIFSVPSMDIRADTYRLQGRAFLFNINNRGTFKATVNNLRVKAILHFGAAGTNTVIKRLNIDYALGSVKAHLSGSTGLVNRGFNRKLSKMLRENKDGVISRVKRGVEQLTNNMFRGHTPAELTEIICKV